MHGFLWDGATMTDVNDLLPANSRWVLNSADAINNNGQIAGLVFTMANRLPTC